MTISTDTDMSKLSPITIEAGGEQVDLSKMTEKQKARLARIDAQMEALAKTRIRLIIKSDKAKRSDRTRRMVVLGAIYEKLISGSDTNEPIGWDATYAQVSENQQYLFPEKWPNAVRPIWRKPKQAA